ncbi:MAG: endonuclease/exonuclease/phosphatase family protein [Bacteroidales bacterium]
MTKIYNTSDTHKESNKNIGKTALKILIELIILCFAIYDYIYISKIFLITPIIFLLSLIFLLISIYKRKISFFIPLISLILSCNFIGGLYHFNIKNKPHEAINGIKVATYNVHGFNHHEKSTILNVTNQLIVEKPQIVCLQEFQGDIHKKEWDYIKKYFPYYAIENGKEDENRLAIFSKYPIIEHEIIFKKNLNGAHYADIIINDLTVRVIDVHFQTTGISQIINKGTDKIMSVSNFNRIIRGKQAEYLAKYINSLQTPTIVCGDFNSTPLSYTYKIINHELEDGYRKIGEKYPTSFNGFYQLLRIDYIFSSTELECTKYYTVKSRLSDHYPVFSTLKLKWAYIAD